VTKTNEASPKHALSETGVSETDVSETGEPRHRGFGGLFRAHRETTTSAH
jgi:hypothetical protein